MPKPTNKVKKAKAWAVINKAMFKIGVIEDYSCSIFFTKRQADEWRKRWANGAGMIYALSVPITISYSLPTPPKKKPLKGKK